MSDRNTRLAATRSGAFPQHTLDTTMVLASHLIITAYGFWLPNDPRGSWSDFVGSWELWKFGDATKVNSRTSRARIAHDKSHREAARAALKYPPVEFNGTQARAIARGFATYIKRAGHLVWACSILPDHVHMVVARSHLKIESIATQLKGAATRRIIEEGIHPLAAYQKPKSTGRRRCGRAANGRCSLIRSKTSAARFDTSRTIRSRRARSASGGVS
jgi:REP element-mobilizing transposase RayT